MTDRTHYITIARSEHGAEFACQDCGALIVTGPDVWVPEHRCPVREAAS